MFTLYKTPSFIRSARKFLKKHPDLRTRLADVLFMLEANPFDPSLRLHPLQGELEGIHAVSLTYAYRILLYLQIDERGITLLDIGSHDDVYFA